MYTLPNIWIFPFLSVLFGVYISIPTSRSLAIENNNSTNTTSTNSALADTNSTDTINLQCMPKEECDYFVPFFENKYVPKEALEKLLQKHQCELDDNKKVVKGIHFYR